MSTQTSKIILSNSESIVSIDFSWINKSDDHVFTLTGINKSDWSPKFALKFSLEDAWKLFFELNKIPTLWKYSFNPQELEQIIQSNSIDNKDVWQILSTILSKDNIFDIFNSINIDEIDFNGLLWIAKLQKFITERESNIDNPSEAFWQKFFEDNVRILQQIFPYPTLYMQWETYVGGKNTKGRNWQWGVATDFLLSSLMCWSFAIVEIKTPQTSLLWSQYRWSEQWTTNISYSLSPDLSWGIIQALNQIHTATDYFRTTLKEEFDNITFYNPQAVLICWSYSSLLDDQSKMKSFSLARKNSKDVIIITFDELLTKAKNLLSYLQSQ